MMRTKPTNSRCFVCGRILGRLSIALRWEIANEKGPGLEKCSVIYRLCSHGCLSDYNDGVNMGEEVPITHDGYEIDPIGYQI